MTYYVECCSLTSIDIAEFLVLGEVAMQNWSVAPKRCNFQKYLVNYATFCTFAAIRKRTSNLIFYHFKMSRIDSTNVFFRVIQLMLRTLKPPLLQTRHLPRNCGNLLPLPPHPTALLPARPRVGRMR